MFCSKCGKELPDNSEFCGYCGANLKDISNNNLNSQEHSTQNQVTYNEDELKQKRIIIILVMIILLGVIIASVFYKINSSNNINVNYKEQSSNISNNDTVKTESISNAYKNILKEYTKENEFMDVEYALTDINNDNIQEIIIMYGTCNADYQLVFYSYRNNEAIKLGTNGCGASELYEMKKGNYLKQVYISGGYEIVWNITYENDKFEVKEVESRELTVEEELNKDFAKGDIVIVFYDAEDMSMLDKI